MVNSPIPARHNASAAYVSFDLAMISDDDDMCVSLRHGLCHGGNNYCGFRVTCCNRFFMFAASGFTSQNLRR